MGCDIHVYFEKKNEDGKFEQAQVGVDESGDVPFDGRNYGTFAFLAGVRNYSDITPIAKPRGIPDDCSEPVRDEYNEWYGGAHIASWLSVDELDTFDYITKMEDRRVTRKVGINYFDRGCTCNNGEGKITTYREFLGPWFFKDLEALKNAKIDRIVFWFDN